MFHGFFFLHCASNTVPDVLAFIILIFYYHYVSIIIMYYWLNWLVLKEFHFRFNQTQTFIQMAFLSCQFDFLFWQRTNGLCQDHIWIDIIVKIAWNSLLDPMCWHCESRKFFLFCSGTKGSESISNHSIGKSCFLFIMHPNVGVFFRCFLFDEKIWNSRRLRMKDWKIYGNS